MRGVWGRHDWRGECGGDMTGEGECGGDMTGEGECGGDMTGEGECRVIPCQVYATFCMSVSNFSQTYFMGRGS